MKKIQIGGHIEARRGMDKVFNYAFVDNEDFDYINQYKWSLDGKGYAKSTISIFLNIDNKNIRRLMHRLVLHPSNSFEIDHKDGNRLNNQKSNIRIATKNENQRNTPKYKNNNSGFKGVSWHKIHNKWSSSIRINGKKKHLGEFENKIDAAKAYNSAAIIYHKDFANFN